MHTAEEVIVKADYMILVSRMIKAYFRQKVKKRLRHMVSNFRKNLAAYRAAVQRVEADFGGGHAGYGSGYLKKRLV